MDFITGVLDIDANWDKYLDDLNNAGYLRLEELCNEYIKNTNR